MWSITFFSLLTVSPPTGPQGVLRSEHRLWLRRLVGVSHGVGDVVLCTLTFLRQRTHWLLLVTGSVHPAHHFLPSPRSDPNTEVGRCVGCCSLCLLITDTSFSRPHLVIASSRCTSSNFQASRARRVASRYVVTMSRPSRSDVFVFICPCRHSLWHSTGWKRCRCEMFGMWAGCLSACRW